MTSTIVVEVVETTGDEDTDVVEFVDAAAVSDVVEDVLDADDVDVVVLEGADVAIDVDVEVEEGVNAVDVVAPVSVVDAIDDVLEKEVVDVAASTDVEEVVVVSTNEGSDVTDEVDEVVSADSVRVADVVDIVVGDNMDVARLPVGVDTDPMEDPVEFVPLWAFAVHPLEIRPATAEKRIRVVKASRTFITQTRLRFICLILAGLANYAL